MLWGTFDWQHGSDNPYGTSQTVSGGTSAVAGTGNIGVRRSTLYFDRASYSPGDDDVTIHFDWLNMTSGSPDDTWTSGDYTTMETLLLAFWTTTKVFSDPSLKLREIRWHRVGTGVTPPNPAERIFLLTTPVVGTGSSFSQPPTTACSITFRTAVRRSWGRTYLPYDAGVIGSNHRPSTSNVDTICGAANTLNTAAAAADFHQVVTSLALSASLNVEKIEVDDVIDVVRRRRWKHTTYRKILP